jgi:hypothetical protein
MVGSQLWLTKWIGVFGGSTRCASSYTVTVSEVVADNLEAEAFVEPSCVDAGDVGVQVNDRRT